jgi:dTDP-L-rhamnose 4-epimerase
MKKILVSGGAGFIGSSLALKLLAAGWDVKVLDNLSEQIHGNDPEKSFLFSRIKKDVEFIRGDVRNKADWERALSGRDSVVHLAAETGTGQSMYQITRYTGVNIDGTAILMEALAEDKDRDDIERLVCASSRAVYGEGKYECSEHGVQYPRARLEKDLLQARFEPLCEVCGKPLEARKTDERSAMQPTSIYGITKLGQEQIVMTMGAALGLPCVSLRFQNVYGPGQSLSNPYTGILAIFTNLLKEGKRINIFEDGKETRDFVFIEDVVDSIILSLSRPAAPGQVFNIGTGVPTSVMEIARLLKEIVGGESKIETTGNFRIGDIRHNFADISRARSVLGFDPKMGMREGVKGFVKWAMTQDAPVSAYEESLIEMKLKGLMK